MRQSRLVKVVAQLQTRVALGADQSLQLERQISESRGEQWILAVALGRKAVERRPIRTHEMGLRIGCQRFLIEARQKNRSAGRFCQTTDIAPVEFHQTTWTGEGRLARRDLIVAQSDASSPPRKGYGSGGNVSTAMRNLESESVGEFVSLGFVYFNQGFLIALVGNGFSRTDAGPIKNIQVIQATFGFQQLSAAHRRLRGYLCRLRDQGHSRMFLAQIHHLVDAHQLVLVNRIGNIEGMRIARGLLHRHFYFYIQVSAIEVCRRYAIAVLGQFAG